MSFQENTVARKIPREDFQVAMYVFEKKKITYNLHTIVMSTEACLEATFY